MVPVMPSASEFPSQKKAYHYRYQADATYEVAAVLNATGFYVHRSTTSCHCIIHGQPCLPAVSLSTIDRWDNNFPITYRFVSLATQDTQHTPYIAH